MDQDTIVWILGLAFWFACALLVAAVADEKRRSFGGWFCVSFFFSPLIALVALAAVPMGEAGALSAAGRTVTVGNTGQGGSEIDREIAKKYPQ